MEKELIIETIDMKKVYGEGEGQVVALDGVSIKICRGEFVAIIGPSGSGKSTLMNILACLDRPTEGKYILAGEDVSGYSRKELAQIRSRELGFVFQSFNLLPRATALENVILPTIYRRENRINQKERVEAAMSALENVGLRDRMDHLPSELSGGQQQRVAIARALINNPLLILADEPTGNLDSRSSKEIIQLLIDLHYQGHTVVVVTHDMGVAHHTERMLMLQDGKLSSDQKNGEAMLSQAIQEVPRGIVEKGVIQ
jgi:putative ABC transport system ATP-binding protein